MPKKPMLISRTDRFFDRLEDRIRIFLSHRPILYAMIGGIGIVLFWRGVWMVADEIPFLNGWYSIALSTLILLVTGLFVSFFIGDRIVLSGLRKEKKLEEMTEREVRVELSELGQVMKRLDGIERQLRAIRAGQKRDIEKIR